MSRRILSGALSLALLLGGPAHVQADAGAVPRVAVIYDDYDDQFAGLIAALVDRIEAQRGISVLRMPLGEPSPFVTLAARGTEPIRLALAEGAGGVAVVFPDIGEPYRGVFARIIEGIEEKVKMRVTAIPVSPNAAPADLAGELRKQDIRVVIALGRQGLKMTAGLERNIEVVAGAVLSVGEMEARNNTIVSLAPDPALLFARLKALQPGIQRVTVVYDPQQNEWLMHLARMAAKAAGIELNALAAGDLKTALHQYQSFFAESGRTDALWLPQDTVTVEDSTVLPLVLKETWDRGMPLFSSSLAHVRRGALFSLYPNNAELGGRLANFALAYMGASGRPTKGIQPLREVLAAVNVRTASHLGINLRQQNFDLLLPER